mmetsp:Transcript_17034/g.23519  ORF Transcript_17034/g.23519 Transcript_17034/m.23519 type:complete len:128 (-) Transcript_17034:261-644(-)|eukprot:CAMPEP_0196571626 /NCGR_PEP_ID=MMETSP1081-20130531/1777_1 /TAXON_ID=36882 /ORGANISM="Pyramimonas amylifera, Strain CCMP720" /LENGTH=127 /DNA_ID=CAMNT_0041888643 /DNA_START=76 /DNA_END=459 /DNA_ORIENTATION=+
MDEKTEKEWSELQAKLLENNGKLKAVIASVRMKETEKKRGELTVQELQELPDETVVYKALGRGFVLAPKIQIQEAMKGGGESLTSELEKMKTTKEYLEREQSGLESEMKELIQNSPFLKARLMGGGQ